jgi:hypothetical protein
MRRLVLAAALCLILPAAAMAQDDAPPPPPGPAAPPPPGGWQGLHHGHGMGGKGHDHGDPGEMLEKFYAANTTHDGHLTLAQAKSADMKPVVEHFAEIDTKHRDYVTFYDIQAWHLDEMAKHLEMKANALRAKD